MSKNMGLSRKYHIWCAGGIFELWGHTQEEAVQRFKESEEGKPYPNFIVNPAYIPEYITFEEYLEMNDRGEIRTIDQAVGRYVNDIEKALDLTLSVLGLSTYMVKHLNKQLDSVKKAVPYLAEQLPETPEMIHYRQLMQELRNTLGDKIAKMDAEEAGHNETNDAKNDDLENPDPDL